MTRFHPIPLSSPGSLRFPALLLLVAGLLSLISLGLTAPAGATAYGLPAADEPTVTVTGTLKDTSQDGAPVEGAEITVTTTQGFSRTVTSDGDGKFSVQVPQPSDLSPITVALDTGSLPEGATLREGARDTVTVPSGTNQASVNFSIGADTRTVETKLDQVPQLIYNGLLFGILLAMGALGLSMVFGTTGLTNFSHGELVTFGAVVAYLFNAVMGWPFLLTVLATAILALGFGWLQDTVLWRPLRHKGTGMIAMMIVSIGLQFFLRNLFQYLTGGKTLNYADHVTPEGRNLFGVTYTVRDLVIAATCIAVILTVTLALSRTRLGRATRAVADNPALAASTGINVDRVISVVWIVGTCLAALSGIFLGFLLGITFQIGQLVLLLLFASVCVGGLGSVWGALVGSLIIGVLIEVSTLVIPSELKTAGALLLLIVILLIRPQGLLGRSERVG